MSIAISFSSTKMLLKSIRASSLLQLSAMRLWVQVVVHVYVIVLLIRKSNPVSPSAPNGYPFFEWDRLKDHRSALLWNQLMGKGVFAVNSNATSLRAYAHCSRERAGMTMLLINLSNQTLYNVDIQSGGNTDVSVNKKKSFAHGLKKTVSWIGNRASDEKLFREEYHLTPENGNLQSDIMLLNGQPLQLTDKGEIPRLLPVFRDITSQLTIAPLSMKFIAFPNFRTPGCK